MVFEDNNPGFWEYDKEGDKLTGVLIKIQENVGPSASMLYTLEVKEKPINVWGTTILDQRMVGIKVGNLIEIIYKGLGKAAAGKNAPKVFQVLVDREPLPSEGKKEEPTVPTSEVQGSLPEKKT